VARREHSSAPARGVYAMRLGADERRLIEAAAAAREQPLSVYIRRVAIESARRDLAER
jgi:uncharacterized protein (DUF1778 family)